jgi:hypothetical protein
MAVRYYGVAVGGVGPSAVTVDTSTTSSDIELAIDDANLTAGDVEKKNKVLTALESIVQNIAQDTGL